ncbi:hypothetical protein PAXINDRAFT_159087, partial [Paxillus involutus ATCC 200175]
RHPIGLICCPILVLRKYLDRPGFCSLERDDTPIVREAIERLEGTADVEETTDFHRISACYIGDVHPGGFWGVTVLEWSLGNLTLRDLNAHFPDTTLVDTVPIFVEDTQYLVTYDTALHNNAAGQCSYLVLRLGPNHKSQSIGICDMVNIGRALQWQVKFKHNNGDVPNQYIGWIRISRASRRGNPTSCKP